VVRRRKSRPGVAGRETGREKEESLEVSSLGKEVPSLKADCVFQAGRCFRLTPLVAMAHHALRNYLSRLQAASEVIPVSFKRSLLKTDTEALRQIADLFVDALQLMVLELGTS